ncbi:transcription termination factor NusA [Peptoanaerobacter stomatis]|uniref:Transcription termination/antitermination protein NusA n=1 Tax=Peptoanaerobacter stomatis TaxID=796937 RepID=J4WFI2_9FIRM|nr:transcription termination factor NusA [Peptoanaerobacter stomatis]EJU24036.1 transcription termination factor NusA [Peptoanaerobacter stomatis]NWO25236.1 transcription termination/antitermination protein NusA [Peptostreptococcaceae bacterium oral taxon 081]
MNAEFLRALEQLEKQRGIKKEILLEAVNQAILNAYKKNYGSNADVEVNIDIKKGEIKIINPITIVDDEKIDIMDNEMTVEYANRFFGKQYKEGDIVREEITPKDFGRIATQAARQIVVQKIKEAEKDIQYTEFKQRETEMITGEIGRISKGTVYVDISLIGENSVTISAEGILPQSEQMATDEYKLGKRMKFYILEVKKNNNKSQIILSRTHPGLVKRLFETEVPEIFDGTVEMVGISREAGSRTKISVKTNIKDVDPIGACVGSKGQRVKNIVDEINNEKIDIIEFDENVADYITSALSPAKVLSVDIDEENKIAKVIVPDDKLSLAIGKEGQNARLAAKLTNWKIDIKCESQDI